MEKSLLTICQYMKMADRGVAIISENEDLLLGFTYRQIMDEVIANYGHNVTEKEIRKQVNEHLEMVKENMEENLMLCIDSMLKEIKEA